VLLHITDEPKVMATMTEEAPATIQTTIDPIMGHALGDDEMAALHHAASSD
jgi:hypothetical protein